MNPRDIAGNEEEEEEQQKQQEVSKATAPLGGLAVKGVPRQSDPRDIEPRYPQHTCEVNMGAVLASVTGV